MEEEIITPEEEVFDYNKLRYILDSDGYVIHASLGAYIVCEFGECTEYIGNIPEGYESIEAWFDEELEKINAWKIVEGNLVFDENKYNELQNKWKIEEEENCCASKKYVNDKFKTTNTIYDDELSSKIEGSSLFTIDNAKEAEIVEIKLTTNKNIKDSLKLKITNENFLGINTISKNENGLSFKVNEDKSITINGEATEDTEFILNGSLTSTDVLFFLKENQNYFKCGLNPKVLLNLYYYDGTDLELIDSSSNGDILFNQTKYVSCATLKVLKGEKLDKVTVYPMLRVGNFSSETQYEYVQCKENELLDIDLESYIFTKFDSILMDRTSYTFNKKMYLFPSDDFFPSDDLFPLDYDVNINGDITTQKTFEDKTLVHCDKDVFIELKYFGKDYLNEKFTQIKIREDAIISEVSEKYTSKEETELVKVELNSTITQTKNEITSAVSSTYETKEHADEKYSEIKQTTDGITSTVAKTYATKTELNTTKSEIKQTADSINLKVEEKLDEEEFTGANIMLAVNNDSSSATINADKISLNGKEINLTSDDIEIASNYFNVNKNGLIQLRDSENIGSVLNITSNDNSSYNSEIRSFGATFRGPDGFIRLESDFAYSGGVIFVAPSETETSNYTRIQNGKVDTVTITQRSLESAKKNFEKLDNGLDIIKDIDIYKYNLKSEEDTTKKHIGFVIGDNYNYSKEVTSNNNDGVDIYSFASVCCKAIQEQQEQIENQNNLIQSLIERIETLQQEIDKLKGGN